MPDQKDYSSLFVALVCFGYIAVIIKFTADLRDFAAMKLIYILPGLLPFGLTLLDGMQAWIESPMTEWAAGLAVDTGLLFLLSLYSLGTLALVVHLMR